MAGCCTQAEYRRLFNRRSASTDARRYRKRTDRFLESADVDELAHEAAPQSGSEAREMAQAEKQGRSHAHVPPNPPDKAVGGAGS